MAFHVSWSGGITKDVLSAGSLVMSLGSLYRLLINEHGFK